MTAPELSAQERETIARFEAAADAPESLRERVAVALTEAKAAHTPFAFPCRCGWTAEFGRGWEERVERHRLMALADAGIAVMRGDR